MDLLTLVSNLFNAALQLPTVGLSILIIVVFIEITLAIAVLRSNARSATNIFFFLLSLFTVLWLVAAYVVRLTTLFPDTVFLERLGIFFGAPQATFFFLLAHTFPGERLRMKVRWLWLIILSTIVVMAINVSPYAFTNASSVVNGSIHPVPGIGFIPFAILAIFFSSLAIYFLIKKFRNSSGTERNQLELVLTGMVLMLGLIIFTILVPILLVGNGTFVVLSPIYTLVLLGMTGYAIVRYGLFNIKVLATEALTMCIWITLFANLFAAGNLAGIIVGSLVLIATIVLGTILINSVRKEVEQREELEMLNAKLDAANQQLEELSRFKSQLLSLASHQIRSPLAAIRGFVSLILDGSYGPVDDNAKEAVRKIGTSADGLIGLINTLLDVRKVEEGKMEYQFAKTDLVKIVAEVTGLLQPLAQAKGLEFSFVPPDHEIWVNVDAEKFKQVVQNLIDNAIKYTPMGFVRVSLSDDAARDPGQWRVATLSVSDSGLGVSAALLPHLFEEFIRDERVKKDIRGTGLGLFIARKIAEAQGGKIFATSGGEGKGSVFSVSIPEVEK